MNVNVSVSNNPRIKSTVSNQPQVITISSNSGQHFSSLSDIDITNAQNGALLQYDATTGVWVASNVIERTGLVINCGNY
jgi:hypothetical protein